MKDAIFLQNNNPNNNPDKLFLRKEKLQAILSSNIFRNFLDAIKLCATKKLPIEFDKNGKHYYHPSLISDKEYELLLHTLLKDFQCCLRENTTNYVNPRTMMDKIMKNRSIQKFDDTSLCQHMGLEFISNVNYIILHLLEHYSQSTLCNNIPENTHGALYRRIHVRCLDKNACNEHMTKEDELITKEIEDNYRIVDQNHVTIEEMIKQRIKKFISNKFQIIKIRFETDMPKSNRFKIISKLNNNILKDTILKKLCEDDIIRRISNYLKLRIWEFTFSTGNGHPILKKLTYDKVCEQYLTKLFVKIFVKSCAMQDYFNTLLRRKNIYTGKEIYYADSNRNNRKIVSFGKIKNKYITKQKILPYLSDIRKKQLFAGNRFGSMNNSNNQI